MDNSTYTARKLGAEGAVFYENRLTAPEHVRTYFPQTQGEETDSYARRPKISFPVIGEVVDRIASLSYDGMQITTGVDQIDSVWAEVAERNEWNELGRRMLTMSLSRGSFLVVIRDMGGCYVDTWTAEYCHFMRTPFYEVCGYEYERCVDESIKPVTSKPSRQRKGITTVSIDNQFFIEQIENTATVVTAHELPFAPFVLMRSVDKDDSNRYGLPFHLRARELLVQYNLTASQALKAIQILQNVWVTDKEADNPNTPLRLDPDTINHVGGGGRLEQAVRQLNLDPEYGMMSRLKQHISSRLQVPDFMTGLSDVGKVESGVALAIVSGPLQELVGRIRYEYTERVRELAAKMLTVEYLSRGMRPPNFELSITLSENVLPIDARSDVQALIDANAAGLIAPQYLESLLARVAALLNLKEAQ